ncbi:MAG: helix-turn-helix domain-containing protein, partial [Candidatus Aminicenantes bacterium]|nr:helix-turn-helix domain-containing protein [Candidatus Aminicenantes bacterium]NIQ70275.1 helix-turn-helix domain-containing protein [Candidatus Aminicenantes bacterium]NIT26306.1 helix-turn-helix domain-containing protein [Candidatus Aminicenantes bacterium]
MMSSSDITINDFNTKWMKSDIGERLSIFRKLVGASPSQLARKLNKKTSHIKAIENGKKLPDFADLIYLEKKYGLNPNWLTSGK